MGGLTVNFAEVEASYEALPEGTYECLIERAEMRQSDDKEYPYINMELKVLDDEFEDRRIWLGASLSPKALSFTKDKLVALGAIEEDDEIDIEWDDDVDITSSEGPLLLNPSLDGMPCTVRTVNRVHEGKESQDAWRSEIVGGGSAPSAGASKKRSTGTSKAKSSGKGGSKASGRSRTRKLR